MIAQTKIPANQADMMRASKGFNSHGQRVLANSGAKNNKAQICEDENILVVGHGGLFHCMFPLIFTNLDDDSIREFQIHNAMPIIAETRPAGLLCTQWGELLL